MPMLSALFLLVAAAAANPIALRPGPHLFNDDYLVGKSSNLVRRTHQPVKLTEPILTKAEPWHEMPLFFQQVLRDPITGRCRMW